ncbi:MAG: NADPH:quinone oxidoreductase family protein [Deltaproteobacteria bacterium]|jgi:NADPH2:quinone reductase|nr:NADPH:quinone oxidoreductase family protein [Deltaproteobacteria bacterium]MBW2532290.1 NADPH:quinone oxidoreductase family protein [Deltaproteobacteria bacterium]
MFRGPADWPLGQRVVVTELGETPLEAVDHFVRLEEQPPPDPASLGPRDVVVAIRSAAVGWVDLLMTSGQYQHLLSPPYTPGLEYSGEVLWTGAEVDPARLPVGGRVLADGSLTGPRSKGAHQAWGGFASYAVAPAEAIHPLPDALSYDQGCNLLGNYETAYHCLIARGDLQAGETALIHGATGSTGLAAVHLAKRMGARVIATGRSPDKLAEVARQGADHVIAVQVDDDGAVAPFRDTVKELTDGKGADLVYDSVGGAISLESLRCVAFGARFLIVGWAATPFVAKGKGQRGAPNANVLPTNLIMMKGLDVLGCPTVISTHRDPSLRGPRLERIFQWVRQGELAPHVAETYPLSEIRQAMRAKWQSRFVGGCVVHPGD